MWRLTTRLLRALASVRVPKIAKPVAVAEQKATETMENRKALAVILCLSSLFVLNHSLGDQPNVILSGPHHDEGPADRYADAYEPINYGQSTRAPLPGLAQSFKLLDWDGDGLIDIVAKIRRGYGIVVYRNVGSKREPLFGTLHETQVLLRDPDLGRYFDLTDVDGDGRLELVGFEKRSAKESQRDVGGRLFVYVNEGTRDQPEWRRSVVNDSRERPILSNVDVWNAPRVHATDWDGDGQTDLIVGYEHLDEMLPESDKSAGRNQLAGFRDPSKYDANIGPRRICLVGCERMSPECKLQPIRTAATRRKTSQECDSQPIRPATRRQPWIKEAFSFSLAFIVPFSNQK